VLDSLLDDGVIAIDDESVLARDLLDDDIGESLNLSAEYSLLAVEHSPLLL
jgi:hypothetical protein